MGLTWTFARGEERLMLQREVDAVRHHLIITHADGGHTLPFNDLEALVRFQTDMDRVLLSTGWLLATFSPDRRRYGDRRTFPRIENDRRRWWTDVRARRSQRAAARRKNSLRTWR
jgi:hypothetical protein